MPRPRPLAALALLTLLSCGTGPKAPVPQDIPLEPAADPALIARGHTLLGELQCARCHDGDALTSPPRERHCVHCHQSILAGEFPAPPADLTRWQHDIIHLRELPELRGLHRLRRSFVAEFIAAPHDLRPRLATSMPRLHLARADAEAIAAALVPTAEPPLTEPAGDPNAAANSSAISAARPATASPASHRSSRARSPHRSTPPPCSAPASRPPTSASPATACAPPPCTPGSPTHPPANPAP